LSDNKIHSEADTSRHSIVWLEKDKVRESISWPHHKLFWDAFLNESPFLKEGRLYNSNNLSGLTTEQARTQIAQKYGKLVTKYKLRDWVFSRQRYWGEPTRKQHRHASDYFIRLGKLVEKVDFHLRIGKDKEFSLVVMEEIDKIVSILAPDSKFKPHDENDSHEVIMNSINAKINKIIVED
jgi:hypothetical protein